MRRGQCPPGINAGGRRAFAVALHGSAFAALTLAHNLLGLAPGPILTGRIADTIGLLDALRFLPIAAVIAALLFLAARRSYLADLDTVASQP